MVPAPQTYDQLVNREQNPQELNLECKDWFWCYNTQLPEPPKPIMIPAENPTPIVRPGNTPAKPDTARSQSWRMP